MNIFFKTIGTKIASGKMLLISVVPDDIFGDVPAIFEVQSIRTTPTIYTGNYPTIRINTDTLKERDDLKGLGVAGMCTECHWYIQKQGDKNLFGINIPS